MRDKHNCGNAKTNPEKQQTDTHTYIYIQREGWTDCLTGKRKTNTYLKYPIPPFQIDLNASVKFPFRNGPDTSPLLCKIEEAFHNDYNELIYKYTMTLGYWLGNHKAVILVYIQSYHLIAKNSALHIMTLKPFASFDQ